MPGRSPKTRNLKIVGFLTKALPVLLLLPGLPSPGLSEYRFLENGNPLSRGSDLGYVLDTPTREKIDLSGTWAYSVEGGPTGQVKIPGAFDFTGRVTLDRKFDVTAEQIDQYRFHIVMLGSNHNTEVSINGDFVTNHIGGYTSFLYPIPPNVVQVGPENVIRVAVSNQLDSRKTLPLRSHVWGWRNYGGIHRDVFILATPRLFIAEAVARAEIASGHGSARVILEAGIDGEMPEWTVEPGKKAPTLGFQAEMFDKISGFSVARSPIVPLVRRENEWQRAKVEFVVDNPKLWSPDSPELYLVKSFIVKVEGKETHVLDQHDINWGMRTIEISKGNILLNGKRIVLRGVVWQEDHPTWGNALTYEEMEKDVVLIKNLGANLVRFAYHPPHPYMMNLCNRYGLMSMVELPAVNIPSSLLGEEYYQELASGMMREMVMRDRNQASLIAWGIGDGFESSSPEARSFVETLARVAKGLDSRPVYFASRMGMADICTDLVDFAALNMYTRDLKVFRKQLEDWKAKHPDQPVLVARFGTEVEQDNRNGYSDPLSYEAQARYFIQRLDIVKSLDYDGAIVWSFNDWRGDRPALTVSTGDPWMHTLGLVSYQREKRLAYDAVRSVFRGEKFAALPIGAYSADAPIIYVLTGLVVLIGTAYVYNASRRFSENLKRSVMNSYNFFADVRDQRSVSLVHTVLLGLMVSVASAIVASSILYHFRESWVLDNLMTYLLLSDTLKEKAIYLIWDPLRSIAYFSVGFFLGLLAVSMVIMLLSVLFKSRIYPFHALTVTFWATPPLMVLVPVGMILYRIMESPLYVVPSLILVGVLGLWVLLRLLKGLSILFDVYPLKVYVVGVLSLTCVLAIVYFYLDYTQSTSMYFRFMYNVMSSQ